MKAHIKIKMIMISALFITLLGLKLTNIINWSYWWVTSPIWGATLLVLFFMLMLFKDYKVYDEELEPKFVLIILYLKGIFTSWRLVGLLLLQFFINLWLFGGMCWLMDKPVLGLYLGCGMGLFSTIMLIIARYYHQKELKKSPK